MSVTTVIRNAALLLALDLPWLYATNQWVGSMIYGIQKRHLELRLAPALVVYIALGYLLTRARSLRDAFLLGLATYAVYDFTNYATLQNYRLEFAIADSLWGGVLMAAAWWVGKRNHWL